MSYPALCIIVYVWQAEHIALEQPLSQLSSTDIVVRIKQEDEFWAPLLGGGGMLLTIFNTHPQPKYWNEKKNMGF